MTTMKIVYKKRGDHYHCEVFTSRAPEQVYAKCGDVTFDTREWPDIVQLWHGAIFVDRTEITR